MTTIADRLHLPTVRNHRGKLVPLGLGVAITAFIVAALAATAAGLAAAGSRPVTVPRLLWVALGCVGVGVAGLYDDLQPNRTRGLARQVRLLLGGRVTSGAVKLVAITAISAGVALALSVRGLRFALAIPIVAGCANLWNLLDVAPGRSLKFFVPATIGLTVFAEGLVYHVLAGAAALPAAVALPFDLRERGMLGDAGANVLGFVVGVEALGPLSVPSLWVTLGVLLALHALAETVTLSRIIQAVPPLRWYDALGRIPAEHTQT